MKSNPSFSLLEIRLLTGRTHQIRVHLAHAGHPVLGDDKYGDFPLNRELAKQGVRRLFLHAARLALEHPLGGERLKLQSELPAELRIFLKTFS
jgi:23S rRNA pseudouridine955/2504/2580 synthase